MKTHINKITVFIGLLAITEVAHAQASGGIGYGQIFTYALLGIVAIIVLSFVVQVADNLLAIEAKQTGLDKTGANFSVFPSWDEIVSKKSAGYLEGKEVVKLKKGHDILLEGEAEPIISGQAHTSSYAMQPRNFVGMSPIPKVVVEKGQKVKAGDELFYDKKRPEIKYVAPVSGEIAAINRAEKRSIAEVVILADDAIEYRTYANFDLKNSSREALVSYLLESGVWPMIQQRPYGIVAEPTVVPRDIFISTFDTAPLAPDLNLMVKGREADFQKGLSVLNKLTEGKVYLGLDARGEEPPAVAYTHADGVEKVWFKGKHPAGNVGVQIHHIAPISTQDKVWTLDVQGVISLGTLFAKGKFDASRVVALVGAELKEPRHVRTYVGASISELLKDNLANDHVRIISGDVLSGQQKDIKSFLNFNDNQLTVIEEGDDYEMFGWLLPLKPRPSISRTFPNFLLPNQKFHATTNTHGEKRAFVVTNDYERVMPMDIYVQSLMKAIMVNDIERMEGLGILELQEEDVALCEFSCVSKMPLQQLLREGLDMMREQG